MSWRLGKIFVLRHAGFPFDWIEELGLSGESLGALDAVLEAEAALRALAPRANLDDALLKGQPPKAPNPKPEGFAAAVTRWQEALKGAEAQWKADRARLRERLHQRAGDEGVQGAVFLSNPSVYENSWRRYAQEPLRPENSDARRLDRQAYTYLQRLCAKNETTSFFGPMGYGEIVEDDSVSLQVVPSDGARLRTFLAFWAVTELSRAIQRDRALRAELTLRLNPMFEVSGEEARCAPLNLKATLTPRLKQLVALLQEGPLSVGALAAKLGVAPGDLEREALPLMQVAFVLRGLPFATHDFDTLESLTESVRAMTVSPARDVWLERLETFARLLREFARGTLAQRRTLLTELERRFTELTGKPARRGEGGVYEDRLIVYEEGASPFALKMGKAFGEALARALSPSLELSASYGAGIQQGYRREIAQQLGPEGELDFLTYTVKTRPAEVAGTRFSPVPPIPIADSGTKELSLEPAALAPPTEGGRFALPDVCLAGATPDKVDALLARVHHHLLVVSWLSAFHPRREDFRGVSQRFIEGEPDAKGLVSLSVRRRNKGFYQYPGRSLLQSVTDANEIGARSLSPTRVKVRLTPEGPNLYGPDGEALQLYFPLDDLSKFAPFAALGHPPVVHAPLKSDTGHTPRIRLGGALYQRERWQLPTAELRTQGFLLQLAVHRARRRRGLPRFVYGRTPVERKPYLFDLESPFALELLKHVIAEVEEVTFEEMFPAPDQLFLRDARGRYTFELRMQAERWTVTPPPAG